MSRLGFITKVLLPQRRPDVLRRPRLIEFLHQHIDRRLLLVCAPAGYGKTTLLVDFARDVDIPVCWYTMDAADGDPRIFLEYLIASIRQRFPDFGQHTEAVLRGSSDLSKDLSAVIGGLVSEIHADIPEYFVLVLDDYHTAEGSDQIKAALDLLLYYLPENCHVVVSSRVIPRLTLSRLTAHRQVAGLGTSDLRFTPEEIKQLLSENHKVLLPAKTAEALAVESEGWIAGIILSTHTMWQGLFESLIRAKGAQGEVFDYLANEVFLQQADEVQRFMLGSSVLGQMDRQLCADLLDETDAGAKLRYLEEANLFVTRLDGEGEWYRYHQLFRAFLENRLRQSDAAWHATLQRKAAVLAAGRESWDEAIGHYTIAADWDAAVSLIISRAAEMVDAGKSTTAARWIDALPKEIVAGQPDLLLTRGRICLKSGEPDRGLELLNQAYSRFTELADRASMVRVLAIRSIGLAVKGRGADAEADCQAAVALLEETETHLASEVIRSLGICHGMQGNFREAVAALSEALRLQQQNGDQNGVATLHQSLGIANARLGDVPTARFHFEQAMSIWRRLGNTGALGQTLNSFGILLFDDGEYDAALDTLAEALAHAREGNYLRTEAAALANIGDVYRSRQRFGEAVDHYERAIDTARRIEDGYLVGYALNGLGDTYARLGEHRRADRFIKQAILQAEERHSAYERGMYETSLGMLHCDLGQATKALRGLVRACEMLEQSGSKRELTRALMARARALHMNGKKKDWLAQLQRALALGSEMDYDQFLVLDGTRCEGLLSSALQHGLADQRLNRAIEQIRALGLASPVPETPLLQAVSQPRLASLRALALGQARVLRDGKEITRNGWASDKVRELFFFLLDHSYSLSKEQIVEAIWPDLPRRSFNSTFHSTMYRLRRALEGDYIVHRQGRYRLVLEADSFADVAEFERLMEEGDRLPAGAEAEGRYRQALALYAGPYLKEFETEWCEARRRQLATKHLALLVKLATIASAGARYMEGIELCLQVLAGDNYSDDGHYLLLKCYVALGDDAAALRHYRRYAAFLREELGVAPSGRIRAICEPLALTKSTPSASR